MVKYVAQGIIKEFSMSIFRRSLYLDALSKWRDKDVIKVLTGIRRCGKSTLLELFREDLLSSVLRSLALSLSILKTRTFLISKCGVMFGNT